MPQTGLYNAWKLLVLPWLTLGVMACEQTTDVRGTPQTPIGTLTVSVERHARDAFFTQLRKFADKHGFAIRIAPIRADQEHFAVELWRSDIKVLGANPFNEINPAQFQIYFYQNGTHPVQRSLLDLTMNDLKRFVAEVEGTKFVDAR